MNKDRKNLFAKDSERLIVDDENMKHVDLFGDIFPMVALFLIMTGALTFIVITALGMFIDL